MPYQPTTGANDAFAEGQFHQANQSGHVNDFTMGNDARDDQGLDDTAARWAELTPTGVNQSASSGQSDAPFEQLQRHEGSYSPGQMPGLVDKLDQGSDSE